MKKGKGQRKTNARLSSQLKKKCRFSSPVHKQSNPNYTDTIKFSQTDMKIKENKDPQAYKDKIYQLSQIKKQLNRVAQDKSDEIYTSMRNIRKLENSKKQLYKKIQRKRWTPINSLKSMCNCRNSFNSQTIKVSFSQTQSQQSEGDNDEELADKDKRIYGYNKKGESFYIV